MIQVSFQTKPAGQYPAVVLEIACQSETQMQKFSALIDRKQFDVTREKNHVYVWGRQRVPNKRHVH